MLTLRRRQSAKPLGRRLVAERTQGVTRNSHLLMPVAQVLGRILMLPIAVLREILQHLDTKALPYKGYWIGHTVLPGINRGEWTGTRRMRNKARLRRRLGQTGWTAYDSAFENLDGILPENLYALGESLDGL